MLFQPLKKWFLPLLTLSVVIITALSLAQQQDNTPGNDANAAAEEAFASHWPMEIDSPQGKVSVFQPQLEDLQGDTLSARAAVSLVPAGQQEPVFGAVWFKSRISTDRVARMVTIVDTDVTQVRFPNAEPGSEKNLETIIEQTLKSQPMDLSLDQLLTMVETAHKEDTGTADLENAPPKVVFTDHPTVKVQYDGDPQFSDVKDSNLQRVQNTPFFVVVDPNSKNCYLKGAGLWFAAPSPLGPFQRIPRAPDPVAALADAENYKDPQDALPADQAAKLEIVTATEPTELIWTDGPPKMGTIAGTNLLYVTNTDSDVFTIIDTQQVYVLLSGRWYTAPNRNGPWAFVPPDKMPADFTKIPPHSDQGDVLAHVAGTQQSMDAVADTYVPQTAAIDRKQFEQPPIEYDGEAKFEPIAADIPASYAVNTNASVVLVDGRYYSCHNAVWYMSARAVGPWDLCTTVPPVIYRIPPSCPIYPVRYVYVYNTTPDYIYCGYTPGYMGCYAYDRVVVYGTGYRYNPWRGRVYCARPYTFGFAAHYNSYVNHWGFSFGLATGGGSLWVGIGGGDDDRRWVRREPWFGPGGYRPVVAHRELHEDIFRRNYTSRVRVERNVTINETRNITVNETRNINSGAQAAAVRRDTLSRDIYDRRKDVKTVAAVAAKPAIARTNPPVARGAAVAQPDRSGRRGDATPAVEPAARGGRNQQPARNADQSASKVLAGRDGNVYRRTDSGGWEVREKGQWRATQGTPALGVPGNAGRDATPAARRGGTNATPEIQTQQLPARDNTPPAARGDRGTRSNDADTARGGRNETPARGNASNDDITAAPAARRGAGNADRGGRSNDADADSGRGARADTAARGNATDDTPAPARRGSAPTVDRTPANVDRGNARGGDTGRGDNAAARGSARGNRGNAAADRSDDSDLDRDYRARVAAENRLRNYRGPADSPSGRSNAPSRGADSNRSADRGNDRGNSPDRGNNADRGARGR